MATAADSVALAKQNKPKKSSGASKPKSPPSHPPFLEMITDAIVILKEKTGSSQYAITKVIEGKHKELPSSFRKLLLFHLKKHVASGGEDVHEDVAGEEGGAGEKAGGEDEELEVSGEESCEAEERKVAGEEKGSGEEGEEVEESDFRVMASPVNLSV
ncbi:hypothetical protein FH972_006399 [Carpinus fangiana]|uniref:H15 domain-containing protein n=1 Tax=Carpinus fangiana TaxID=176857 RepID=A0A5N6QS68_9ROSI|nr:hypothetical protein FH972_006399 [Carpinus fangiana]